MTEHESLPEARRQQAVAEEQQRKTDELINRADALRAASHDRIRSSAERQAATKRRLRRSKLLPRPGWAARPNRADHLRGS